MNNVLILGRVTKDLELRYTAGANSVAVIRTSIAVNRPFAKKDDEIKADFFNVVVWGKMAENMANYVGKGNRILVRGRVQNNNYTDNNGVKRYGVDIIAEQVEFIDFRDDKKQGNSYIPDGLDEEGYRAINDDDVPF